MLHTSIFPGVSLFESALQREVPTTIMSFGTRGWRERRREERRDLLLCLGLTYSKGNTVRTIIKMTHARWGEGPLEGRARELRWAVGACSVMRINI